MVLYLFRHGETLITKAGLSGYGDQQLTAEILPEGFPAINRLAEFLKTTETFLNFSSPFLRCRQTTRIVTKITQKKFLYDKRIGEYLPEKETFKQFSLRVTDFLNNLNNDRVYIICTHGAVLSAIKYLVIYGKYTPADLMDFPKPGVLWIIKERVLSQKNFRTAK